jgi:hypothetical protein
MCGWGETGILGHRPCVNCDSRGSGMSADATRRSVAKCSGRAFRHGIVCGFEQIGDNGVEVEITAR